MTGPMKSPKMGELDPLILKFKNLGIDSEADLKAAMSLVKVKETVRKGKNIIDLPDAPGQLTVMLGGVACLNKRLEDGGRQIYTFQLPGDFCDLHRYVLPEADQTVTVTALTSCSIGIIRHEDLDQMISEHPKLGLAFWRASMLEASIFQERLLNISRRTALPRIASIICEQLARLEVVNIRSAVLPITQVDLADAGGLSVVHVNRVIRELRDLGALSNRRRTLEVANMERLTQLAGFDKRYLNMPSQLSGWKIDLDDGPAH